MNRPAPETVGAPAPAAGDSAAVTDVEKIRRLKWVVWNSGLNAFFASIVIGSPVLILFLTALGMPKTRVGFLLSLFPFCGLLGLLTTPLVDRFGAKWTHISLIGVRKLVILLLILAPWFSARWSAAALFAYVAAVILAFAVCRAVAEAAAYPWSHEFVPANVRGRFGAVNNIVGSLGGILALGFSSWMLGRATGFAGYQILIAVACVVGIVSVVMLVPVPGGEPSATHGRAFPLVADLRECSQDRNFVRFLAGMGCLVLASAPMAFLPLFLRERIGLSDSYIVMVQTPAMIGGLLTALLWGWAVDRYGSKPVLITSLAASLVLPFCWLFLPRGTDLSGPLALAVALAAGIVGTGTGAAAGVLLYNRIVPPTRKTAYFAVFYAWVGLTGGLAPLAAGWALDHLPALPVSLLGRPLDAYAMLFLGGAGLTLLALLAYQQLPAGPELSTRKFLGLFTQGNPFTAAGAIIRYSWASTEDDRLIATQRLAEVKSPLSRQEIVEAMSDPSFNVRFEAVLAAARSQPDLELVAALVNVLEQADPGLSATAAWALGELGDPAAVGPLQQALDSADPGIETRAARALGRLGDSSCRALLRERLRVPSRGPRRVAYATALGRLRDEEAIPDVLALLDETDANLPLQQELGLCIARVLGQEKAFMQLWKQTQPSLGEGLARALLAKPRARQAHSAKTGTEARALAECADRFARGDLHGGARHLVTVLADQPSSAAHPSRACVAAACVRALRADGAPRPVHLLLAVLVLKEPRAAQDQACSSGAGPAGETDGGSRE